jgi:hypothetical protein
MKPEGERIACVGHRQNGRNGDIIDRIFRYLGIIDHRDYSPSLYSFGWWLGRSDQRIGRGHAKLHGQRPPEVALEDIAEAQIRNRGLPIISDEMTYETLQSLEKVMADWVVNLTETKR